MNEYTSRVAMFSRIAGEMNAMGEIDLDGGMGSYTDFESFVDDCVRKYNGVESFDLYADECLYKEYPADYTKECRDLSDRVFSKLFFGSPYEHDGLRECPSGGYQLVISALEAFRWEVNSQLDREIINRATGICENLRNAQKRREFLRARKREEAKA
jgi:hypothetical protein